MRRAAFLLSVWTVFASAASAEIQVRSGAHDGFARLVLDVPPGTDWTADQDTSGIDVRLIGYAGGFDTTAVFDRIDRSFVGGVEASGGSIRVAFNCACSADVFRAGDRMVVIDVRAEEPTDNQTGTLSLRNRFSFVGRTPLKFNSSNPPVTVEANEIGNEAPNQRVEPVTAVQTPEITFETSPSIAIDRVAQTRELDGLKQAQEKLAERIGLAATTGVLRPTADRIDLPTFEGRPQIDTRVFDNTVSAPTPVQQTPPITGNLRITSSRDLPNSAADQLPTSTSLDVRCLDPARVRVQDWGDGFDFATGIARLRRVLFSEFDKLNHEAAVDLAQRYLHYGFGAEAIELLSLNADLAQDHPALFDIANVMEFGTAAAGTYLPRFLDCDTDVALWAILSAGDLQPTDTVDSSAAIRALSSLPLHLRRHVAPALSQKLLAYGDKNGAAAALRGLERTAEPLTSAGQLAKADIELAQGDVAAAQVRLADVVSSNDQQSAQALVRYVETQFDADVQIDEDIATLVEAYAIEFRDDPLGDDLRRSHVLALAKSDQFDAAFEALERVRSSGKSSTPDKLRSTVLELLAKDASEATFLRHAFLSMRAAQDALSPRATQLMAARLTDLGFFREAEILLLSQEDDRPNTEKRILRARISLGLSRPYEALAFLANTSGDAADRLRADARAHAGDYEGAHELFSELGEEDNRNRTAWLSDSWTALTELDQPVFGPTAEIAATALDTSPALDGMLGRVSATLNESSRARDVIKDLLVANESNEIAAN